MGNVVELQRIMGNFIVTAAKDVPTMCNLGELHRGIANEFRGIAKDYGYKSNCDGCKGL